MNTTRKILVGLCIAAIVLLLYFAIKVYYMKEPQKGAGCKNAGELWDEGCTTLQEVTLDPTLTSPAGKRLSLLSFVVDSAIGAPFTSPVWYRFRYVNSHTGGYSEFSDWTSTPVISGGCCQPCAIGVGVDCAQRSCDSNKPTIGILKSQLDYTLDKPLPDGALVYVSMHSYIGGTTPPASNVQSTPVTNLYPAGDYYSMIDYSNPCGGGKCSGRCSTSSACGSCT